MKPEEKDLSRLVGRTIVSAKRLRHSRSEFGLKIVLDDGSVVESYWTIDDDGCEVKYPDGTSEDAWA
jgi:hypothetical protein